MQIGRVLRHIGHRIFPAPQAPLYGDRAVENSWVTAHLPHQAGTILDFGCGASDFSLIASMMGHKVVAVDLLPEAPAPYKRLPRTFIQGDILELDLSEYSFDAIINCSAVEHVGLSQRYNQDIANPDGDLKAMSRLGNWLSPKGRMLLTIPVGQDAVFQPQHRIYGVERLPRLLDGFMPVKESFWARTDNGKWTEVERKEALTVKGREDFYALGLFILSKE